MICFKETQELLVAIDVAIKQANDVKVVEADEAEKIMNFLHKGNI
jgi:ADP-glucose pyrophosphorylase